MKSGWLFFIAAALILSWSVAAFGQAALQCGDNVNYAFPIPEFPFSDNGTTVGYINDYSYCGSDNAPDVVYGYQAFYDTPLMISLCNGSDFDTKLYVFEDTPGNTVACNDDYCGYQSQISCMMIHGGHTYYFIVDGYGTESGAYYIDFSFPMLPPPISGTVTESGNGPISGATVRVLQNDTPVWEDTTQDDGWYMVIYLSFGTYTVEASKQGFYTQTSAPFSIGECDGEVVGGAHHVGGDVHRQRGHDRREHRGAGSRLNLHVRLSGLRVCQDGQYLDHRDCSYHPEQRLAIAVVLSRPAGSGRTR